MMIELSGTSVRNKGAELMTAAICHRFETQHPEVNIAAPQRFGTADERFRYGLWFKLSSERYALNRRLPFREKLAIQIAERILPKGLATECGIVTNNRVTALLDASGFAFGDQLPVNRIKDFNEGLKPLKKRGIPVVLLPQAFGPFSNPSHKEAMKRLMEMSDLMFARDALSFQHLKDLSGQDERIQQCPDLTLAVEAPPHRTNARFPITVVPNSRMLDKLSPEDSERYQDCLARIIHHAKQRQLPLQILLHDRQEDKQFVEILKDRAGSTMDTITDEDPIRLKSILASSALVISSRFHALAGALSSGVPSIAMGWSHKYEELMSDFGLSKWSLSSKQASEEIESIMDSILLPETHARITLSLNQQMNHIRQKVAMMWHHVDQVIGLA